MRTRHLLLAAIVVALLLPGAAHAALFQSVSGPQSAGSGIVLGPDGNLWVAEQYNGSVLRISPSGVVIARYATGGWPEGVTVGPGGRVWVAVSKTDVGAGANKVVWFDATSANPTAHDIATPVDCGASGIAADGVGRIYFSLPSDGACNGGVSSYGTVKDDGSGAATGFAGGSGTSFDLAVVGGKLFAPDFDGGVVRRLSLGTTPAVEATYTFADPGSGPDGITGDSAGNVWVTMWNTGQLVRFPSTQGGGQLPVITPTGGSLGNPFGIQQGGDGRIYVTGKASTNLLRVSADGTQFAFYAMPQAEPFGIANGPDGDLFLTDQSQLPLIRFVNAAPRAATGGATATTLVSGSVQATVDPRGNATSVVFDYGPTTAYGLTSAPTSLAGGAAPVPVTAALASLAPGTTYHVRVRATNAEGSATGADTTFTTPLGIVDRFFPPPARPPRLAATATFTYVAGKRSTTITALRLRRLVGGETARLTCKGSKRCPFTTRTYKGLKKGEKVLGRALWKKRKLPAKTVLSVRITRPGTVGSSAVLTVRKAKRPTLARACLAPGAVKTSRCA